MRASGGMSGKGLGGAMGGWCEDGVEVGGFWSGWVDVAMSMLVGR